MRSKLMFGLIVVMFGLSSCKDGCVECTGPTAPQTICKDDFNQASDYEQYVSHYEQEEGAVCE